MKFAQIRSAAGNGCHPGQEKGLKGKKRERESVSMRLGEQNRAADFIFYTYKLLLFRSIQKHTCSPEHTCLSVNNQSYPHSKRGSLQPLAFSLSLLVSESVCIKKPVLIENAFEKQSDLVTALRSDYLAPLLLPLAPRAVWMVASLSSASVSSSFFFFFSLPILKNPHREMWLLCGVANKRRSTRTFEVGGTL